VVVLVVALLVALLVAALLVVVLVHGLHNERQHAPLLLLLL
jgi:hypothetical protein